jgi:hypothetical protein
VHFDSSGVGHGFLYDHGVYTTPDDPSASPGFTGTTGINDAGQIVGVRVESSGFAHGFLLSQGVYTTVEDPLGVGSFASRINVRGQIVGEYFDGSGVGPGFLRDPCGGKGN